MTKIKKYFGTSIIQLMDIQTLPLHAVVFCNDYTNYCLTETWQFYYDSYACAHTVLYFNSCPTLHQPNRQYPHPTPTRPTTPSSEEMFKECGRRRPTCPISSPMSRTGELKKNISLRNLEYLGKKRIAFCNTDP